MISGKHRHVIQLRAWVAVVAPFALAANLDLGQIAAPAALTSTAAMGSHRKSGCTPPGGNGPRARWQEATEPGQNR